MVLHLCTYRWSEREENSKPWSVSHTVNGSHRRSRARATERARERASDRARASIDRSTSRDDAKDRAKTGKVMTDCERARASGMNATKASGADEDEALGRFMSFELEKKTTAIAKLELEVWELRRRTENEGNARARALEAQRVTHEKEREIRDAAWAREREALTARVEAARSFAENKAAHDDELRKVKSENARLTEVIATQREEMERELIARTGALKRECEERVERAKKQAETTMDRKMDQSVKRILAQNRKMADELRLHVAETDVLQRQYATTSAECRRLAQRAEMTEGLEREYAERGATRAKEMKKADEKISTLERGIHELMEAFETQKSEWKSKMDDLRASNEDEVDHLKRALTLKTRELVNIRRLAKEVVCYYEDV